MKRKVILTLLVILIAMPVVNLAAENHGSDVKPFGLDAGVILSTGYINTGDPAYSGVSILFLLRGGFTVTGRYRFTEMMSAGAEIGLTYMSMSSDGGVTKTTWIDIPMHATFRFGSGKTFIEPHVGYYLSASVMDFSGFSVGAKGSLGGFYVDLTYVIGNTFKYPRFGLGWQWNNIF